MKTLGIRSHQVKKETEKAMLIEVDVYTSRDERTMDRWFPKSQIEITDGKLYVAKWLVDNINDEIKKYNWGLCVDFVIN